MIQGPSRPRRSSPAARSPGRSTQQQGRQGSQPNLSRAIQLKAIPSARSVYLGQQVTLSYKIYFRARIRDFDFVDHPETVSFWVEEYPLSGEATITREIVDGVQYNVAEIKRLALFPNKTGKLTIPPVTITVDAVVPQASRDPFDLFDNFFDNPFGKVIRRRIVSNPVTIQVKPLPEAGKPADFSGLVGDFRITSSLDKKEVPANEAISYRVKIQGQGLLKTLNALPIEFPLSFEVFDPKVQEKVNRQGRYIASSKELEYVLIPRTPGDFQIPELRLSFFNPLTAQYQQLVVPAYTVHVTRGKEVATGLTGTLVSKEEVALLGKDIRFIKERLSLRPIGYRVYRSMWFWAAFFLPSLLLAGAYGYQAHQRRLQSDVVFARKRRASRLARKHLKAARQLLKQKQYEAFYAEISRALIGFIADKTNRSAAGLTQADIEQLLKSRQVPEPLIQDCLACLGEADMRRFAGMSASSSTEAEALLEKVERLMENLEKHLS
ncbi:MAG: protein BatD [Calditrichaeota bacterium]|nr:MAG: protein BatD [Calditrichota bacterium]